MNFLFLLYWSFLSVVVSASPSYSNTTVIATQVIETEYVTVCPSTTIITVTHCENSHCTPTTISVSESTTLTLTSILCPTTTTITQGGTTTTNNGITTTAKATTTEEEIEVTRFIVTDYTTICPESTILTITKCSNQLCHPSVTTITESTEVTIIGEVLCSSTVTVTSQEQIPSFDTIVVILTSEQVIGGKTSTITEANEVITTIQGGFTTETVYSSTEVIEIGKTVTSTYTSLSQSIITEIQTIEHFTTTFPSATNVIIKTCDACNPTTILATQGQTLSFETVIVSNEVTSFNPVTITTTTTNSPCHTCGNSNPSIQPIIGSGSELGSGSSTTNGIITVAGGNLIKIESYFFGLVVLLISFVI
ncbi:hypothetical protein KGF54_000100 [Candida jiufengensis]|uniref:uncharacterized protein n=1 Tax=Candida jiufengensis TaxID=497108 RepID=UPI00222573BD|nr:uncharacterized protein KGF54_000100 [Candida jiufengensis]KAI5957172.1 hypothetical protein KGF54_000100 [Candida jiufengensis]